MEGVINAEIRERQKARHRARQNRLYHKWKLDPEWKKRVKAQRAAWYAKNTEKVKAQVAARRQAINRMRRARRQADLATARAKARARYHRYGDKIRAGARIRYSKTTPERKRLLNQRAKVYLKRKADELADVYVRNKLTRNSNLPSTAWPAALVELKRAELKLKRHLKGLDYGKTK